METWKKALCSTHLVSNSCKMSLDSLTVGCYFTIISRIHKVIAEYGTEKGKKDSKILTCTPSTTRTLSRKKQPMARQINGDVTNFPARTLN